MTVTSIITPVICKMTATTLLELTEYQSRLLPPDALTDKLAQTLLRDYAQFVTLDWPSPRTGGQWRLTAGGWVGYLPVARDFTIALRPKVPLRNLFRLIEYAYDLPDLRFDDGLIEVETLADVYDLLALLLARRVLARCRRGIYCAYAERTARGGVVRGRLLVSEMAREPWRVDVPCRDEIHTADVAENQIIAWSLHVILRSATLSERARPTVRRALRALTPAVSLQPFTARGCRSCTYTRLNRDYQPLHALCAFFLEHSGPAHEAGSGAMLPFVVNMASLYERFVAAWLQRHLPPERSLTVQERHHLESANDAASLYFDLDLVLYNRKREAALCVLDTKYKADVRPATADIAQVAAYAQAKSAPDALLVYPLAPPALPRLDARLGGVRVRGVAFALDGDLEENGHSFLASLP